MTAILLGGQVLPVILLLLGLLSWPEPWPNWQLALALVCDRRGLLPSPGRGCGAPPVSPGAILHPLGILILLAIQWFAFLRNALGRPSTWKGALSHSRSASESAHPARELEPTT